MRETQRLEYGTLGIGCCALGSVPVITFLIAAETVNDFDLWSPVYGTIFVVSCLSIAFGLYLMLAVFLPLPVPPLRGEEARWKLPSFRRAQSADAQRPLPGLRHAGRQRASWRRALVLATTGALTGVLMVVAIRTLVVRPIVEATEQHVFQVPAGATLDPVTIHSEGTCSPSFADPDRESAYKCSPPGEPRRDPCFVGGYFWNQGRYEAACFPDPWGTREFNGFPTTRAYLFSDVSLERTSPRAKDGWQRPWALELEGGYRCLLLLRRPGLDPDGTYYPCFKETLDPTGETSDQTGEASGWVFDYPSHSTARWTVPLLRAGETRTRTTGVIRAWR